MTNYTIDQLTEAAAVRRALASEAEHIRANGSAETARQLASLALGLRVESLLRLSAIISKVAA